MIYGDRNQRDRDNLLSTVEDIFSLSIKYDGQNFGLGVGKPMYTTIIRWNNLHKESKTQSQYFVTFITCILKSPQKRI